MTARVLVAAVLGAMLGVVAVALYVSVRAADPVAAPSSDTGSDDERASAVAAPASSVDAPFEVWGRTDDGTPVRWDPCAPIPWVLDPDEAPADARAVVSRAMSMITAASGLTFEYRGTVDEQPRRDRPLLDADGDAWAPVLITWVPGGSTDLPMGDAERGVTVPVAVQDGGPQVFVTGQVLFNSDKTLLPGFDDRHASWGAVVVHELAHLVGLDHVADARQLMNPTPGFGPVELGAGDRAGLAAVGADGGCVSTPEPQELTVTFD